MFTLFKSFLVGIFVIIASLLSLVPALAFHASIYYLIGADYPAYLNIVTITLGIIASFFLTRRDSFVYRVLRYLENL